MKNITFYSTRYLATLSTLLLSSGVGLLTVCLIQLLGYQDIQARKSWDLGMNCLIAGLVAGAGACKSNQIHRNLEKS